MRRNSLIPFFLAAIVLVATPQVPGEVPGSSLDVTLGFDAASYRYAGVVGPYLGGSVRALRTVRYWDAPGIAIDGSVGAGAALLANVLGPGDLAARIVPVQGEQRTTIMLGDRYGIWLSLRFGTLIHFEPGWTPVFAFAISAELGNRLQLLPWLAVDLSASATHATPRGIDVSMIASHVGLSVRP